MYLKKARIKNIRSIVDFEIEFQNPAGWHVLIGDNGAGKSTIIRSIAFALAGGEINGLRSNPDDWLNRQSTEGEIVTLFQRDRTLDTVEINTSLNIAQLDTKREYLKAIENDELSVEVIFLKEKDSVHVEIFQASPLEKAGEFWLVNKTHGFFSAAYGPYRRFEGGSPEWEKVFDNPNLANLAAHLSVFDESVALTEAIKWLKDLNYKSLEKDKESQRTLEHVRMLIDSNDFLPHGTKLETVSSDGVFFNDGNGNTISVNQMSDGYRSILSMTFELIRQLIRVYGAEMVFRRIEETGEHFIDLPGVVLIDEIDAHLHPTWQTRIGQWFTKYFPRLQFIITSHSPLVCRAAENGTIWRLARPDSGHESGEITGLDKDRLVFGNVLDAYGTEAFGSGVSISRESNEMLNRLAELNVKSMIGEINDSEHIELQDLKAVLPTESKL